MAAPPLGKPPVPARRARASRRAAAACAAGALAAGGLAALPASAAPAAAPAAVRAAAAAPPAVTAVAAQPVHGGVRVSWTPAAPAAGDPPVQGYLVGGGPGTCAVAAAAGATSVVVPATADAHAGTWTVVPYSALGLGAPASAPGTTVPGAGGGVRVVAADGQVVARGDGVLLPALAPAARITAAAATADGTGVWAVDGHGAVTTTGTAVALGGVSVHLPVQIVPTADGRGYSVVGTDGSVASRGTAAQTLGAVAGAPAVAAVRTAAGGLWVFKTDGRVYRVGAAPRPAALRLPAGTAVAAATATRTGAGAWAVLTDGQVLAVGDAAPLARRAVPAGQKVVEALRTPTGAGLWAVTTGGALLSYGDAPALTTVGRGLRPRGLVNAAYETAAVSVQVLGVTDFHGALETSSSKVGGAAVLKAYFDADRAAAGAASPTYLVSSGDNWGAAPPLSALNGEVPTVEALNLWGLDVSATGNHEHDKNPAELNALLARSTATWVASNYSTTAAFPKLRPSVTLGRGGLPVAFVGANTPQTMDTNTPASLGGATIADPVAPVQRQVDAARAAGAKAVVVLSHNGYEQDVAGAATGPLVDQAKAQRGVNLVLGGHTHLRFQGVYGGVVAEQTVNAGQQYTRTQVCVDAATGGAYGSFGQVVVPDATKVTPDAAVAAMLAPYQKELAARLDVKVGTTPAVYPNGGTPQVQRTSETALGNLVTDAIRARYGTQLALVNGGGIRDTLPAATYRPADAALRRPGPGTTGPYDVVLGDVYTVLPFGNSVATTTVTGAKLWAALENGVSQVESGAGRFPQISGFAFTFDPAKPAGSRVVSVSTAAGAPIAADGTVYTIATVDYMINGGDGYTQFDPKTAVIRDLMAQVVAEAVQAAGALPAPATQGRITRAG